MLIRKLLILLLTVQPIVLMSQSRWTNIYYPNEDTYGSFLAESYDHGLLLVGKHGHNAVPFNWLIKTDINGQILWNKTIGIIDYTLVLLHISTNKRGSIYGAGATNYLDEFVDPIIIKIDSCGEKEWCKIIYNPGSLNYATQVISTQDNGCAVLLYSGLNISEDRVCLARFSSDGELLWNNCYNSIDTSIANPWGQSVIQTPDRGFLISGHCGYEDPNQPNLFWSKPYFIKTDSIGSFEWETIVYENVGGENGGSAWSTSINPSRLYYYSSISHYYPGAKSPALLKMDLLGNIVDIYDIVTGYTYGGLTYATFINDSILACGVGWGNTEDDIINYAALIDTSGIIIDSKFLIQDIYTIHMDTVFDEKLVYMYNTFQNNQFDVYLTKLNYELEDDTFYTFPFQYDTLCPYPIASDTISQEGCDIIVGIGEEEMGREGDGGRMELYPNPATDQINCRLQIASPAYGVADCRSSLLIYDMFGRKQEEIQIPKGQKEIQIDVSAYPQGIYIAVLQSEQEILDRKKFVVQ